MSISKSKIKTWDTCNLLYYFQHLEHRKPDFPPANVTQIGKDIHKIFEDFYDHIKLEEIPEQPYEYFINAMTVEDRYRSIFNHFCKVQSDLYTITTNKKYFMPLMREKEIIVEDYHGFIDRIDWDGENYSIIDYKSNVGNPSNLRFELHFYKYLIEKAGILDMPVKYIGSYGYNDGGIFFEEVNDRSYKSMLKKVEEYKSLDFSKMEFKPKFPDKCHLSWCQYPVSCKKYKSQVRF